MSTDTKIRIVAVFGGREVDHPEIFQGFLEGINMRFKEIYPEEDEIQILAWGSDCPEADLFIIPTSIAWDEAIQIRNSNKSARVVVLTDLLEFLQLGNEVGITVVSKDLFINCSREFFETILGR